MLGRSNGQSQIFLDKRTAVKIAHVENFFSRRKERTAVATAQTALALARQLMSRASEYYLDSVGNLGVHSFSINDRISAVNFLTNGMVTSSDIE
jgi:hypothetical protein